MSNESIGYWHNSMPMKIEDGVRPGITKQELLADIRAIVREEVRKALHDVFMVPQTPLEAGQELED